MWGGGQRRSVEWRGRRVERLASGYGEWVWCEAHDGAEGRRAGGGMLTRKQRRAWPGGGGFGKAIRARAMVSIIRQRQEWQQRRRWHGEAWGRKRSNLLAEPSDRTAAARAATWHNGREEGRSRSEQRTAVALRTAMSAAAEDSACPHAAAVASCAPHNRQGTGSASKCMARGSRMHRTRSDRG